MPSNRRCDGKHRHPKRQRLPIGKIVPGNCTTRICPQATQTRRAMTGPALASHGLRKFRARSSRAPSCPDCHREHRSTVRRGRHCDAGCFLSGRSGRRRCRFREPSCCACARPDRSELGRNSRGGTKCRCSGRPCCTIGTEYTDRRDNAAGGCERDSACRHKRLADASAHRRSQSPGAGSAGQFDLRQ